MKTNGKISGQVPQKADAAFTLIDLAVVIATLGILAALMLPALAGTKTESTSFQCENNMKQLALAWTMYSNEGNDLLCNMSTYQDSYTRDVVNYKYGVPWRSSFSAGFNCCYYTPAMLPTTGGLTAQHRWLTELGFTQPTSVITGPIYRFCKNVDAVHCPADWRCLLKDSPGFSGPYGWDSYGGSGGLNGENVSDPHNIFKLSGVTRPSNKFIWTEGAAMRGENLGSWWMNNYGTLVHGTMNWNTASFGDSPAAFHVGASIFNFCDGHVELHKWQDPRTVAYANSTTPDKDTSNAPQDAAGRTPNNVDATWVAQHYAGLQNP